MTIIINCHVTYGWLSTTTECGTGVMYMLGTGRVGLGRSLKVGRSTEKCGYTRLSLWIWSQATSWELVRVYGGKAQTDSFSQTLDKGLQNLARWISMTPSIYFFGFVKFSLYKSSISFLRFTPRYVFEATVSDVASIISFIV